MHELPGTDVYVPIIETPRLRLRGPTIEDFDGSLAMWGDERVTRYIGGRPQTVDEVWSRVLRYIGHWAALGYGLWAVEEKATGAFIGDLGFMDGKRGFSPDFTDYPEMGWTLAPAAQGKGYASEALAAAIAWGDEHFDVSRYVCMIAPENAASIRVAEKAGFREYKRVDFKGSPSILFERIRL